MPNSRLFEDGYDDGYSGRPPKYPLTHDLSDKYWVGYDRGTLDRINEQRRERQLREMLRTGSHHRVR